MILEEATKDFFGYYPNDLTPQSNKSIITACELCGMFRITTKWQYSPLCLSCLHERNGITRVCKTCKKEFEVPPCRVKEGKGKYCSKICSEKGRRTCGRVITKARSHAKRDRELGYTLLMPLIEGEVGHHVTNEYVIGIPKEVHQSFSGGTREKHRTKVLQWFKANDKKKYKMVLCVSVCI